MGHFRVVVGRVSCGGQEVNERALGNFPGGSGHFPMVDEYRNSDALPGKKVHFHHPNKPIPKPITSKKDDPIVL